MAAMVRPDAYRGPNARRLGPPRRWNRGRVGVGDASSRAAFGRTVPAVAENVASVRKSVVALARNHGATDAVQGDLALAVGEACANVVVHAYPPGETGPMIVHAEVRRERGDIVVSITDLGQGMTPRPDSPGLGLGLPLIANLAGTLEIRDGPAGLGTEVIIGFTLR